MAKVMQGLSVVRRLFWSSNNSYSWIPRKPKLIQDVRHRNMCSKSEGANKSADKDVGNASNPLGGKGTHYVPNSLDKRILVWMKKYPSIEAVPAFVSQSTMERARNMFRIKGMIYMIVVTFLASIVVSWSGKQAAKRGESVVKMNEEFHRAQREKDKPETRNK